MFTSTKEYQRISKNELQTWNELQTFFADFAFYYV